MSTRRGLTKLNMARPDCGIITSPSICTSTEGKDLLAILLADERFGADQCVTVLSQF